MLFNVIDFTLSRMGHLDFSTNYTGWIVFLIVYKVRKITAIFLSSYKCVPLERPGQCLRIQQNLVFWSNMHTKMLIFRIIWPKVRYRSQFVNFFQNSTIKVTNIAHFYFIIILSSHTKKITKVYTFVQSGYVFIFLYFSLFVLCFGKSMGAPLSLYFCTQIKLFSNIALT